MNISHMKTLCQRLQLGKLLSTKKIRGGHLHKVYQLITEKGYFACKEICWHSAIDTNRYTAAEKIAVAAALHHLPAIAALTTESEVIIAIESSNYLIYPWIAGRSLTVDEIKLQHVAKMGLLLAKLHQLSMPIEVAQSDYFLVSPDKLAKLIKKALRSHFTFNARLANYADQLILLGKQSQQINQQQCQQNLVISHCDLHTTNVLWIDKQFPNIIDWELAGKIHPTVELMGVALNWSQHESGMIDWQRFHQIFTSYGQAGGELKIDLPTAFLAMMATWLGWLEYNLASCLQTINNQKAIKEINHTLFIVQFLTDNSNPAKQELMENIERI